MIKEMRVGKCSGGRPYICTKNGSGQTVYLMKNGNLSVTCGKEGFYNTTQSAKAFMKFWVLEYRYH